MTNNFRKLALIAAIAAGLLPASAAQAQYYGPGNTPPPLYPYAVQADRPYAVEVAPNTYVIQRGATVRADPRAYPYVRCQDCAQPATGRQAEPVAPAFDRPHKPADRALIEELRKRAHGKKDERAADRDQVKHGKIKHTVINTTKIVRDPPVVIETKRVVDDPPRVIERYHVVEDEPVRSHRKPAAVEERETKKHAGADDTKKRVIQADAEITILGPDRMSIQLFRKGHGPKANARAE